MFGGRSAERMDKRRLRRFGTIGSAYLLAGVALSSTDLEYVWYSPIVDASGDATPWYASAGLSQGALVLTNHEHLATGLHARLHRPAFFPLAIGGIGGPEGGLAFVSTWFLALTVWGIHLAIASMLIRQREKSGVRAGAAEPRVAADRAAPGG
jgi:hypothetical protein